MEKSITKPMKSMNNLDVSDGRVDVKLIREITIKNIKDMLSFNKQISVDDIFSIGVIETGQMQFKVPMLIKDRQVIYLLAYLIWFYGIDKEELK